MSFREKYGEWGFVAGGSEGMGGAYASRLAKEGMNVIVTGRHQETVDAKAAQLRADYGVEAKGLVIDFGEYDILDKVKEATEGLEIGFLVYNAGLASMAAYDERDIDYELYRLNVNVRSELMLSLYFSKQMKERGKGGMIFMSSCGGIVGTPYIQVYSATKAYNFTLAEALWGEYNGTGIDVMAVLAGNTIGQNFKEVPKGTEGFQTGEEVVEEAFEAFGKVPVMISGEYNRNMMKDVFHPEVRQGYILQMKAAMEAIRAEYGSGEDAK